MGQILCKDRYSGYIDINKTNFFNMTKFKLIKLMTSIYVCAILRYCAICRLVAQCVDPQIALRDLQIAALRESTDCANPQIVPDI